MHVYIPHHISLCGYNRTMCTSLTPYPFAAQVRLQQHYVYIPLPISRLLPNPDNVPQPQASDAVSQRRCVMDQFAGYTVGWAKAAATFMDQAGWGDSRMFRRACVDCGLITGSFCDYCSAADRIPEEEWAPKQFTPLCTKCDDKNHGICHFCRGVAWVAPPPHVGK